MAAVFSRLGLIAILCCDFAHAAAAQEVTGGDRPKDEPKAEIALKDCVAHASDFQEHNGAPAYVITLENKCERRFVCKVNVNVTNAYGSVHGQATLRLGPHAAGDVAKKSYALKVKQLGGMAQESRQCEVL